MIGFIMMGGSASLETQIHRKLPEGVEMVTTRVPFHNVSYFHEYTKAICAESRAAALSSAGGAVYENS